MELSGVRGCAFAFGVAAAVAMSGSEAARAAQCGRAAWFDLTGVTASGERADGSSLTAAHRSLPFQTKVKVENLANGRTVVVRVNDRGPFSKGRVIDVSKAAAQKLGFINNGTTRVRVTVVDGSRSALPSTCDADDGTTAAPEIIEASIQVEVPPPRPRPLDERTADAAVAEIIPEDAIGIGAEPASGDLTQRFDDAFAPEAADLALVEPLLEKAESMPPVMPMDPHHGLVPREDWDHFQGVPN